MTGCHEGKDYYEAWGVLPAYVNGRRRPQKGPHTAEYF